MPTNDTPESSTKTPASDAAQAVGPAPAPLSPIDRARIRVATGCDDKTIKSYPNVRAASRMRIERAALELGISLVGQGATVRRSNPPPADR